MNRQTDQSLRLSLCVLVLTLVFIAPSRLQAEDGGDGKHFGSRKAPTAQESDAAANAAKGKITPAAAAPANNLGVAAAPQNGGTDAGRVDSINQSTQSMLGLSAMKDKLLEDNKINVEDWLMLSNGMNNILQNAAKKNRGTGDVNYQAPASTGGQSMGSGAFQGSFSTSPESNVISAGAATTPLAPISEPVSQGTIASPEVVNLNGQYPVVLQQGSTDQAGKSGPADENKLSFDESTPNRAKEENKSAPMTLTGAIAAVINDKKPENGLSTEQKALLKLQNKANEKAFKTVNARNQKNADDTKDTAVGKIVATTQMAADTLKSLTASGPARGLASVEADGKSEALRDAIEFPAHEDDSDSIYGPVTHISAEQDWEAIALAGAALTLLLGLGAFMLMRKRFSKQRMHILIPMPGEHFSIREGSSGKFIIDIKDVKGNLIRTAGTLRPQSVTRAAILPPEMAVKLGAAGSFDRFELNDEGKFVPTDKEEGYQVFPFVDDADKLSA